MNDWLDAEIRAERALELSEAQQWGRALDELNAAIEINPNDANWHAQRGHILDQLRRYDEAIEAYEQARALVPEAPELATAQATDLIRVGRYRDAIRLLEQIASEHPGFEPAYCHQIAAYTRLAEHEKAEELFYMAQQVYDECPNCFHHLAESLACRGQYDRAIHCWQRTLEIEPRYPHARQRIAEAYRAANQLERARDLFVQALRHDPGNTEILMDLGHLLIDLNDDAGARGKFELVLELEPGNASAHVMIGLIDSQRDACDEAVDHFRAALALDTEVPGIRAHLGDAELRRGNHFEARRVLVQALEEDPNDTVALMAMGNCLLELGRPEEAERHFTLLARIEPKMVGAYHNHAVCRFLMNDFKTGIALCRKALEIDPVNLMVMNKLALAYMHERRWREAREITNRGLAIDPNHAGLRMIPRTFLWRRLRRLVGRLRQG